ncbi:MAG: aromatic ring-hydroxylating oxygenase subunit alpha [Candidatus Nanopelagicales bacterium]
MTDLIETSSLPALTLTVDEMAGESNYRREVEHFFSRGWLYLCHHSEIPAAGDFLSLELAERRIFVVRTRDGGVAAHYNVCPHRGSELVTSDSGNCGRTISCPYHGWAFGHQGEFIGAPYRPDGLVGSQWGLRTLQTDVWNGMVFVSFSRVPIGAVEIQLAGVDLEQWQLGAAKVVSKTEYVVEANWKVLWENGLECYHCGLNHPELAKVVNIVRDGPQPNHLSQGEFDYRPTFPLLPHAKSATLDGEYGCSRLLGGIDAAPTGMGFLQWHTSIFEVVLSPDNAHIMTYLPLSPSRSLVRMAMLVHHDAREGIDFEQDRLNGLQQTVRKQDDVVCERVQRGLESGAYASGPYNPAYEFMNQNFVRLYREVMSEA